MATFIRRTTLSFAVSSALLKGTADGACSGSAHGEFVRVENDSKASLPDDLRQYQQVILEKQTLTFCIETRRRIGGRLGSAGGICGVWSSDRILREFR